MQLLRGLKKPFTGPLKGYGILHSTHKQYDPYITKWVQFGIQVSCDPRERSVDVSKFVVQKRYKLFFS